MKVLDFFRKAGEIIGIKSLSGGRDSVVDEFFSEVAQYQQALTQSFAGIHGKERAARVARLDKDLLSADSHLFKSSKLSADFMPAGFSEAENLLFLWGQTWRKRLSSRSIPRAAYRAT